MLESIIAVMGVLCVLVLLADVRRKSYAHTRTVQKEREAIAEQTLSTATLSAFREGKGTEVLLGVSEDSGLFFYRRIDNGVLVLHYTVRLNNLLAAVLQVNGETMNFESESGSLTAQMRSTDIAKRVRQAASAEFFERVRHIRLNIFFRSADGKDKNIPVTMYHEHQPKVGDTVSKTFENAVWWQQYVTQLARRKSENDLITTSNSDADTADITTN